jgi:transposase
VGRQSRYTTERVERFLNGIRKGATQQAAAAAAGIGRRTIYTWLQRHPAFAHALEQAEADVELRMVSIIVEAAKIDARHAEWWLERRRPDEYARRDKLDLNLEIYVRRRARELGLDEDEALDAVRPQLRSLG